MQTIAAACQHRGMRVKFGLRFKPCKERLLPFNWIYLGQSDAYAEAEMAAKFFTFQKMATDEQWRRIMGQMQSEDGLRKQKTFQPSRQIRVYLELIWTKRINN